MKKLIVLMIVLAVFAGGNVFAENSFEKDDALWREARMLAKAGKLDEALIKTEEMSSQRKETTRHMIAVIAADDFQNYDKAIEIGKTLNETERREHLWLYIPRSAAINQDYDGFMAVVEKTIPLVFNEISKNIILDYNNADDGMNFIKKTTEDYLNSLYRDAAVIYANRGLLRENVKVIKSLARGTDYYKSAVTATVIELINGLHSRPEALDDYLASLNYRKIADNSENIVYGGAARNIVAYNTPNTNQSDSDVLLLLYDEEGDGNWAFLTALFLDEKTRNYLTPTPAK